jgi:hypothetical protein
MVSKRTIVRFWMNGIFSEFAHHLRLCGPDRMWETAQAMLTIISYHNEMVLQLRLGHLDTGCKWGRRHASIYAFMLHQARKVIILSNTI